MVISFSNGLSTFGGIILAYPMAHPFTAYSPGLIPMNSQNSGSFDNSDIKVISRNPNPRAVAFNHIFSRQCANEYCAIGGNPSFSATIIIYGVLKLNPETAITLLKILLL